VHGGLLLALLERDGFDFFAGVPCCKHTPETIRTRFRQSLASA